MRALHASRKTLSAADAIPEAELVALARSKDEAAIRELIRRCNRQLFRVARGILHDDSEAEDTVQAAYVSAFTKIEGFKGEATFATWLTRITMNEAYGRLRRRARIVNIADYRMEVERITSTSFSPPPTTPEAELGRTEVRHFLEHAIDALPDSLRLTYLLRDVQDVPARDVADLLGINPLTVKTRLYRARRRLREEISHNLAAEFAGVFPFDGVRCSGMADRVLLALNRPSG